MGRSMSHHKPLLEFQTQLQELIIINIKIYYKKF